MLAVDLAGEIEKAALLAGDQGEITLDIIQKVWGIESEINITASVAKIAIIGKIAGTLIAKPFIRFNWKQTYLIGWAMNKLPLIVKIEEGL